jgi:hypothetical protein
VARRIRRNLISEIKETIAFERGELAAAEDYLNGTTESERAQDETAVPARMS